MSESKHIAVIRLSAMGDVAMTIPVLRAFSEQHPEVKITMISRAVFKPFFNGIANLDFIAFDAKGRHKGFLGLLKFYSELKRHNIDAFADLHNVIRSKIISTLFKLSGKKTATVDKARAEKKALTRSRNKVFRQLKPITQRYAEVFDQLGFKIDLSKIDLRSKLPLSAEVLSITGAKQNHKWIGVAPFAQYESKVYPQDLMQQVIDSLATNQLYKIFLFGGGDKETKLLNALARDHKNSIVIAGKLSLEQELQLISNLDAMLSMDSGNAHLAAMYGVNVATLWGATHPFAGFAPFNQPIENAILSDREKFPALPTSIYGNKKVEGYEDAMRTIKPKTVVEKIENLLSGRQSQ